MQVLGRVYFVFLNVIANIKSYAALVIKLLLIFFTFETEAISDEDHVLFLSFEELHYHPEVVKFSLELPR